MTPQELQAIRGRCDKATPGPWYYWNRPDNDLVATGKNKGKLICGLADIIGRPHDFTFIAHARQDIPRLLAHIDELQQWLDEAEKDTERLDWVIKQGPPGASLQEWFSHDAWELAVSHVQDMNPEYNTDAICFRRAIDSAMQAQKEGK